MVITMPIWQLPREVVVPSNAPGTRRVGRCIGTAGASGFSVRHIVNASS